MTDVKLTSPVPRLSLRREEAAEALGVSEDFFDSRVRHELRAVRRGRIILYPVAELEAWLASSAEHILEGEAA